MAEVARAFRFGRPLPRGCADAGRVFVVICAAEAGRVCPTALEDRTSCGGEGKGGVNRRDA